jgi:membrane fusion protein (multidrug efflux system)
MSTPSASANGNGARRRRLLAFAALLAVAGIAYGVYWLVFARNYESTDDAYVAGDVVQITSEVAGTVIALHADDTQAVTRGQPLLELDPADARVAVNAAEAELARSVRQVRGLYAQGDQLRAQIQQHETELQRAVDDYNRRQTLASDGGVSAEELAHARDTIATLRAGLTAVHEQLDATVAQTEGTTVPTHPQVLAAAANVRAAALALRRTRITAPVAGVVARRSVQIGQRVAAGAPLMAVVPLGDVWVDANFKEVQLDRMRVGQPVVLHADLYGSDVDFHGRIAGLSAGSGSAFALLPPQNASGNWIKIVQRVPVRIELDAREVQAHPLRIGLSMRVKVDVRDSSGPLVASQVRNVPLPVQDSAGDDPAIEARIAAIIRDNAGAGAAASARRTGNSVAAGMP